MKKTVILGATENPDRYAYRAAHALVQAGHPIVAVGSHQGTTAGQPILALPPELHDVDTVTIYLNTENQKQYHDYILNLRPQRVVFNPGAENPELEEKLAKAGIAYEQACTLVLLATRAY